MKLMKFFLSMSFLACNATMFGMDDNGNKTYNSIDELATAMIEAANAKIKNEGTKSQVKQLIIQYCQRFAESTSLKNGWLDILEIYNNIYSLGFTDAINNFRTQSTNYPNSSLLEDPYTVTTGETAIPLRDAAASLTTHTFSYVRITPKDIKDASAEEPTGHSSYSNDENTGPLSKSRPTVEQPKPAYTFTRFLGSPLFMGLVTVSVAAIAYIYWHKEKNKHDDDQDMALDNPEEVVA